MTERPRGDQLDRDLRDRLIARYGPLMPLSGGAWSSAMRGVLDDRDVVVRVTPHADDVRADAEVAALKVDGLFAPEVFELRRLRPPHEDLVVCVSAFCPGTPLEDVEARQWPALVPAVADLLAVMRSVPAPPDAAPWRDVLLNCDPDEGEDPRLAGWRARLERLPGQRAAHAAAVERLRELVTEPEVADVERTLVHADLLHRNVHVVGDRLSGVFDWGCRVWGDHLYDLAWFVFWRSWHPNLDVDLLVDELVQRWGHSLPVRRMQACLLHIGVGHLVYNAAIDDPDGGAEVLSRMRDLDLL